MHIVVTGGAGFIGSAVVRRLLRGRGVAAGVQRVSVIDAFTYAGRPENLEELQTDDRFTLHVGDVADDEFVESVLGAGGNSRVDAVLHLAAESHVDRSLEDPAVFVRTNVQGTRALLDAARRHEIERFVHVSTDEVYGPLAPPARADEDTPFSPSSPYAVTKAAADMMALAYYRSFQLPVIVVRMSNCYGPRQFPEKLIPLACQRVLADESIPVYGDGRQVREWLYVEDAAEAIVAAMARGTVGQAYNIAAGEAQARENLTLLHLLLDHLGKPRELLEHVKDRPGHDRRYAITGDRATAELGWTASTALEEGLPRTLDWYVANADWVRAALEHKGVSSFMAKQYAERGSPSSGGGSA